MKLLLHACCGPCACYPTEMLTARGVDFTLLYYNPNIHPYEEFRRRVQALSELARKGQYKLVVDKQYPLEWWLRGALAEPGIRCAWCYRVRMQYAARYAKAHGFDAFSTTLLVSPYQKHELLRKVAEEVAAAEGIPFYYEDFRPGYEQGKARSIALGLYRQGYCGCVMSERDRYMKPVKALPDGVADGDVVVVNKFLAEVRHAPDSAFKRLS